MLHACAHAGMKIYVFLSSLCDMLSSISVSDSSSVILFRNFIR